MAIPIVITKDGLQPQAPADLRAQLVALVSAQVPGYTANLPGSLIEDVASTDTYALAMCDQAVVELVNSLTPYGANEFVLNQFGQVYGVPRGANTNTSVEVEFSGPAGFVIGRGFTVSDGTHQYVVQAGVIIPSGGTTDRVYCVANAPGTWSVPAGSVTALVTSVPSGTVITVTNPTDGVPSSGEQSIESYRVAILRAGQSASTGMATTLRTALGNVSGVQERLVSIRAIGAQEWEIIVGGGDQYDVAYAIFSSIPDITMLGGSTDAGRNETVTIDDYPDAYDVVFVRPPQQDVGISLTWNTSGGNFVSPVSVAELGTAALVEYVNGVYVGKPMNLFEMQRVFQDAVADLIPTPLLTRMVFTVEIDGNVTPPDMGTGVIDGDPEGYFFTDASLITITQG